LAHQLLFLSIGNSDTGPAVNGTLPQECPYTSRPAWALGHRQTATNPQRPGPPLAAKVGHSDAAVDMLGTCRRILRDDHDAEDVTQATFLSFVRIR
jgi:hypothetical protein